MTKVVHRNSGYYAHKVTIIPEPGMLTAHQVAEHFGVTLHSVDKWQRLGMPSCQYELGGRRFKWDEVVEWGRVTGRHPKTHPDWYKPKNQASSGGR